MRNIKAVGRRINVSYKGNLIFTLIQTSGTNCSI